LLPSYNPTSSNLPQGSPHLSGLPGGVGFPVTTPRLLQPALMDGDTPSNAGTIVCSRLPARSRSNTLQIVLSTDSPRRPRCMPVILSMRAGANRSRQTRSPMIFLNTSACGVECERRYGHQLGYGLSSIGDLFRRSPLGLAFQNTLRIHTVATNKRTRDFSITVA
jgi:hypothetical protein